VLPSNGATPGIQTLITNRPNGWKMRACPPEQVEKSLRDIPTSLRQRPACTFCRGGHIEARKKPGDVL